MHVCVHVYIFITKANTHDLGEVETVVWQLCPSSTQYPSQWGRDAS